MFFILVVCAVVVVVVVAELSLQACQPGGFFYPFGMKCLFEPTWNLFSFFKPTDHQQETGSNILDRFDVDG